MSRTLTQKILEAHASGPVIEASGYQRVYVDLFLAHDATLTLGIERIVRHGLALLPPERLLLAADHFAPPSSPERASILRCYLDFLEEHELPRGQLFRGISHQLAAEDPRVLPGTVVVGADSHTTMVGALGCFATGVGTTDALAVMATGNVFERVPPSILIEFAGQSPNWTEGKDLALAVLRELGEDGALGHALEIHDHTATGIDMGARLAIANHAVEAGATNAIFVPDRITRDFLIERDGHASPQASFPSPDVDARYARRMRVDVASLAPLVARPGSPADVVPVTEVLGTPIHQAFLGSCAGGREHEIEAAARLLRGHRVADGVRLVVTPASQRVWEATAASGALSALTAAGAQVTNASCGACGGIDKGLLGAGETCVSTSNRNSPGRMGHREALIYLASAATVAASALTGRIEDPRPLLDASPALEVRA